VCSPQEEPRRKLLSVIPPSRALFVEWKDEKKGSKGDKAMKRGFWIEDCTQIFAITGAPLPAYYGAELKEWASPFSLGMQSVAALSDLWL